MIRSRKLMLPLVASVLVFLAFSPNLTHSQSTDSTDETPTTTISTTTSATLEETTRTEESTTPTVSVSESPLTTPESVEPPASSLSPPAEGSFNSPCNATQDCQPLKNLQCLEGACRCPTPQIFDLRVERCVIPLGKQCDSSDILNENMCPEFAECFMDRCVCKTGYSMHTLTRCKSDLIEASGERKPLVLWPPPSTANEKEESDDNGSCTSETCDESKGLTCQEDKCKCKDSQEIYVEEFGRCLNTTVQKTLKDALSIVGTSDDEIKSFVKLLEKIDGADQESEGSDHYNSPVHQLLGLLGGDEYRGGSSQVAPPSPYRGDLHSAAQESVGKTAMPNGGLEKRIVAGPPDLGTGDGSRDSSISPVSAANAETSTESGEAMTYNSGHESVKRPSSPQYGSLPLDNLHYSPQSQEPAIVQRQAPPYLQGDGIQGIGNNPGQHYRLPIQAGYGGGLGPYGDQIGYPGGLGGYGGIGGLGGYGNPAFGGYGGLGGFGGVPGGFRNPEAVVPPPPEEPKEKEGLLIDVAEFVGRSLKLVDRFLPLVHAINDALKKEGIFEKKEGGLFASLAGAVAGARDRRFGEPSKEVEDLAKEGGILSGFARFVGILIRLKRRLLLSGDETLKKLLT